MRDAGILARDSVARRINRETFLLLGGTAALLLQIAHPLVAAGVDQHSDFRRARLGRLVHTLDTTLAIVYARRAEAEGSLRRIDRMHAAVRGKAADGRAYRARDPGLLLWVQTTLVLTSLRWYELVLGRLPAEDREAYWSEGKFFAERLGVPVSLLPRSVADLQQYERRMLATEVVPDATAVAVARDVARPLPRIPRAVYWPNDAITAGLLPESIRAAFGLPFGIAERRFQRATIVAIRAARPLVPRWLSVVPQARRYEREFGTS